MQCPRCDEPLAAREIHDTPVVGCQRCGGMYLNRGDLNRIAEPTAGDLEFSTLDEESFRHPDAHGATRCPRCAGATDKVEFNIYTGIILDHCARCGGFWLDGRELERINAEVRELNKTAGTGGEPAMLWFARFIWSLPR